jgi:hypothetical protein
MSTDFGVNVSTLLNTLESCVEYLAYTRKLQIWELVSKLSGSQYPEAYTNDYEILAISNELHSTGGIETSPQDTSSSGSISSSLKANIHFMPQIQVSSSIPQDSSQTNSMQSGNIHADCMNQVKSCLQPEDKPYPEIFQKTWKVLR